MSLLYECINGIIQGGILDSADDIAGADEIATLCVNKLRGMIMINGDANREYHHLNSEENSFQRLTHQFSKICCLVGL